MGRRARWRRASRSRCRRAAAPSSASGLRRSWARTCPGALPARGACSPERAPWVTRTLRGCSSHFTVCCPLQVHPSLTAAPPAVTGRWHWQPRYRGAAAAAPRRTRPAPNSVAPWQVRARGAALRVAGRAGRGGTCGVRGGARPRCFLRLVAVTQGHRLSSWCKVGRAACRSGDRRRAGSGQRAPAWGVTHRGSQLRHAGCAQQGALAASSIFVVRHACTSVCTSANAL